MSCDVGGESTGDDTGSPLTVRCRWRTSNDIQAYTVSVECDTMCDDLCISLADAVTAAVHLVSRHLSARCVKGVGVGLRAFVRADCFSAAELYQGLYLFCSLYYLVL